MIPEPRLTAAALVFVTDLDSPELSEADAHHLGRVLRLRDGAAVCAADGLGGWRLCTFRTRGELEATEQTGDTAGDGPSLTVGLALVKADKPDLVVQKLTELGVDRVVFFAARRSVSRWHEDKVERNLARLRKVARSACEQSRRLVLPMIEIGDLPTLLAAGAVVADFGGRPLEPADRTVLVGPEGGWDNGEYGDAPVVDLGPNVLRAETAAIAVAARMCAMARP